MPGLSAHRVAEYLVWAAQRNNAPLTNMGLLKVLYYAQGWFLALYGTALFREPVRAWKQGPVVASVYRAFKHSGKHPIIASDDPPDLPESIRAHLDKVLGVFGSCGAFELKHMTHAEEPWLSARDGYNPDEPSNVEMPVEEMKKFFHKLLRGHRLEPRFDWSRKALAERAKEEEIRFGKALSWANDTYGEALQRLAK